MIRVPVTVVGEGPLASWHRQVLAQQAGCDLLANGLPDRTGFVDLCGPPETCTEAIAVAVRARVPLVLSFSTQWPVGELERLASATRKHRVPTLVLGSLRLFPAIARLKEIVSTEVLGTVRTVRIERQGTDFHPATGIADPALAVWRDADLCQWLAAESSDCSTAEGEGDAARCIQVMGELGELHLRFAAGQTPELTVQFGSRQSLRRVPALGSRAAHLAELNLAVTIRQHEQPWLLLPSLAEVVNATARR